MHEWTWDSDNNPTKLLVPYRPYLFIENRGTSKPDGYGIDNAKLLKKEFLNDYERSKFATTYKGKLYYYLPVTQQYLLDKYSHLDIKDLTKNDLRAFFFDIEVVSDEFPNPAEAKFPITSITIYDTETKKYYVWGIKMYHVWTVKDHLKGIEPEEIVYEYCNTEKTLLKRFLAFWRKNFPDVIVGYNSYAFDMPYIVHRMNTVFEDEKKAADLSPVANIYGSDKENRYGQTYKEYTIGGVSHLDYMVLYKYFTPGERESDGLDFVCKSEVGAGKLDYGDTSLQDLSVIDWNRFINYNIWDVKLMVMLDARKKYLDIARFSTAYGFCNIDKALGKTAIVAGVLATQALSKNLYISTQLEGEYEKIPGGYVKQPEPGMYKNIISVDANSLYPSNIITLNISPETKVGKVMKTNDDGTIVVFSFKGNKMITTTKDKLNALLKDKNYSLSSAGIIFDQSKKSVCSEFVDSLYQKRKLVKKNMIKIEQEMAKMDKKDPDYAAKETLASQLDTEQYLYKILLNSTYGVLANRFFPLYDLDCAKSITLTGQAMIKESEKITNKFIKETWGLDKKDRCVAVDTDSNYFCIDDVIQQLGIDLVDANGDLTPEIVDLETKLVNNLNEKIKEWAEETLNSKDPRFEFKREAICPKAIWTGGKNYLMHLKNVEGVKTDKIKYKGLMVVKATFSDVAKNIAKDIIKGIMESPDKGAADNKFFEYYDSFSKLPVVDVSERISVKSMKDYQGQCDGMKTPSGCPRHIKAAIHYNELLKKLDIHNKYSQIEGGKKIKIIYIKPNKFNLESIAYLDVLPPEFEFEVDRERMFEKCVTNCLTPIYDALKWKVPDPTKRYEISLDDFFSSF